MDINNFAGGKWYRPKGEARAILNPADGTTVLGELTYSDSTEVDKAVAAAAAAFPAWRDTPVVKRCRILFRCKQLLEDNFERIATCLTLENGKLISESEGDVRRGIEVVEFAAGMPTLSKGDLIEDIAANIDGYIYREPLGVVAGICPFNFPAMIPLWMFPVAIACGNTFVLKPSEKCPMTATLIAEIFQQGGLPDGVLNVVHGGRETVEALVASETVQAISFVGSTGAAKAVWQTGTASGKRVQALGGAKNFIFVMPDADPENTLAAIMGSSFGCAGERCMASSILMLVGEAEKILPDVVAAAKALKVGDPMVSGTQMGALISKEHKQRVESYIAIGVEDGAELLLDGRGVTVADRPDGFYVGPTLLDKVTPEMRVAKEEIFGPVLSIMRAGDLDEALQIANGSAFGNGASIFTNSGGAAKTFRRNIECGMVGVNAGVPAPMAFFSFGGRKQSLFGDLRAHGPDGVEFYTKKKAIIERWFDSGATGSVWGK